MNRFPFRVPRFGFSGKRIGSGVDIETDCDCDTDTDPDNAVRAASIGSNNQASGSAGGYYYFNGERETGNEERIGSEVDTETDCDCDTETDPDNAVHAVSSSLHNQASDSAWGILLPQRGTGNGKRKGDKARRLMRESNICRSMSIIAANAARG